MLKDRLVLYSVERTRDETTRKSTETKRPYKTIFAEAEAVAADDLYAAAISVKKEVIKYVIAYRILQDIPSTVTQVLRKGETWTLERFVRDKITRNALYLTRSAN